MKRQADSNKPGHWRVLRLLATAMAMLCLAVTQVGLAQDSQPADQPASIASVPATRQADKVVLLPIRTAIDRFTMKGLEQRLARAEREAAQAVVIELDTPGGEVGAVLEISDLLKTSQVPIIVAWVNNTAFSGGAIIAMMFFGGGNREGGNVLFAVGAILIGVVGATIIKSMVSRSREFVADADGAAIAGSPDGLIGALRKLEMYSKRIPMHNPNPAQNNLFIVEPLTGGKALSDLFATHPPTEKRVAALLRAS